VTKGVFLHKADSIYDDEPAERYQFPASYLKRALPLIGDWVIYKGTEKSDRPGYFGIAKVQDIVPDPSAPGRYLALIEPNSYLDFERDVPFRTSEGQVEREMPNAVWAVRPLAIADFNRIIALGFPDEEAPLLPRTDPSLEAPFIPGVSEVQAPFALDVDRDRVSRLSSRLVRDRTFRTRVLQAYDCRCAITGLRLINGGGRPEVQAAHIKPVSELGPDSITNGLALSGTAHWMFDRGLISLSDELQVIVSRQVNDAESVWGLVNTTRRAVVPASPALRPHPSYLEWHREVCFKQ
jgi:putative restriction endonuclease